MPHGSFLFGQLLGQRTCKQSEQPLFTSGFILELPLDKTELMGLVLNPLADFNLLFCSISIVRPCSPSSSINLPINLISWLSANLIGNDSLQLLSGLLKSLRFMFHRCFDKGGLNWYRGCSTTSKSSTKLSVAALSSPRSRRSGFLEFSVELEASIMSRSSVSVTLSESLSLSWTSNARLYSSVSSLSSTHWILFLGFSKLSSVGLLSAALTSTTVVETTLSLWCSPDCGTFPSHRSGKNDMLKVSASSLSESTSLNLFGVWSLVCDLVRPLSGDCEYPDGGSLDLWVWALVSLVKYSSSSGDTNVASGSLGLLLLVCLLEKEICFWSDARFSARVFFSWSVNSFSKCICSSLLFLLHTKQLRFFFQRYEPGNLCVVTCWSWQADHWFLGVETVHCLISWFGANRNVRCVIVGVCINKDLGRKKGMTQTLDLISLQTFH